MKAICLLLCLALAQGHIFRRPRYPDIERLIVKPLDDIIVANQEYQPEAYRPIMGRRGVMIKSWSDVQRREEEGTPKKMSAPRPPYHNTKNENQEYVGVHRDSSDERDREESLWNMQKSHEYAMPVYADVIPTMNSRSYQVQAEIQPTYGDSVAWRGVEFAAAPSSADVVKTEIERIFSDAYDTVKHLSKERKEELHQAYVQAAEKANEDSHLNATELLQKYQYPVETHTVKTDDGYILTVFRILPKEQPQGQTKMQRPVVFLMHGLLGSADDWLVMGPGKSLAYMLADAGYEVWLGNARGNKYSRRHVTKHPAQNDFWQYSIDEIALHDLPAMIDYALHTSQQERLSYVGYSLGNTVFFALAATRPEYNDKIAMMYAMSPMVYMSEVRSPLLRMIAPTSPFYERLRMNLGHGEFKPSQELVHTLGGSMCENEIGCKNVCSNVNFVMAGFNMDNLDVEYVPIIMAHLATGVSVRVMKHIAQAVASHEFTRYDYGAMINEEVYGSSRPPRYDMSKVNAPVALYYSEEDWLAHPKDVERLAKELPHVKDSYKVMEPHFSHMDYLFAKNADSVIYNRLMDSIKQNAHQTYVY